MNFFLLQSFLNYSFRAQSVEILRGYDASVFDLFDVIMNDSHRYYAFDDIEDYRDCLKDSDRQISMVDYGAGSTVFKNNKRRVSSLASNSSVRPKYGRLLFRLANQLKPSLVMELGTSIGISSSYLAKGNVKSRIVTMEGCPETSAIAAETFKALECDNVSLYNEQFDSGLSSKVSAHEEIDLVFIDGNHQKEATLNYFNAFLPKLNETSVLIFDDINWSAGMSEAWQIIRNHPRVTLSVDVFQFGIVFFNSKLNKEHFVLRY